MRLYIRTNFVLCCGLVLIPILVQLWEWRRTVIVTHPPPPVHSSTKLILSWLPFFGDPYYGFGSGRNAFIQQGCVINDCEITDDRLQVPQHHFDAILFHGYDFYEILFGKPLNRSPHQRYVFVSLESPRLSPIPERFKNFYNITLTYRLDSDIVWQYFVVRDLQNEQRVAPSLQAKWRRPIAPQLNQERWINILKIIRRKEKPARAAWFVSNCHSESGRESLAHELSKYFPVDVYGRCGSEACPSMKHPNCTKLLIERYHFYFGFENSLCEDYLTEKVLHALQSYTIPVVLSGANFTRFLPPRSFVSAFGMPPAELAARLKTITETPESFASYLWWLDYYSFERTMPPSDQLAEGTHPFCQLCALLHTSPVDSDRNRDIHSWWMGTEGQPSCFDPN